VTDALAERSNITHLQIGKRKTQKTKKIKESRRKKK
jgi:hypothetical protein